LLLNLAVIVIGYLLGSFPSAYIMGRLRKGIDIRNYDMGNMGAGNVIRHVGIWEGIVVILADVSKGAGAILIAQALEVSQPWLLGAGFSALLGHSFPIFVGFRGGRGSATLIGIFLVLAPKEIGVTFGIMAIPFVITHNNAFSLFIGFTFLPLVIWLFGGSMTLVFYSLAVLVFLIARSFPMVKQSIDDVRKNRTIAASHHSRRD